MNSGDGNDPSPTFNSGRRVMEIPDFPGIPHREIRMRGGFAAYLGRVAAVLASIWKLAVPYFRSEDRRAGRLLLAAVIGLELGAVGITVLINQWNARFYNALQDRSWNNFVHEILVFACSLPCLSGCASLKP